MRIAKRSSVLIWAVSVFGLLGASLLVAEDPPPPVKLHGGAQLAPPADAPNQDASGSVKLLQWGERIAIHVRVRHLEPGAAYDVKATKDGEAEAAVLGTITTYDGTPPPPRCFRASLKAPETTEEPPADGGDGACHGPRGDGHHGPGKAGFAVLMLTEDLAELGYTVYVRDLPEGAKVEIVFTDATTDPVTETRLDLPLDEKNQGKVPVTAEQVAALAAGNADLVVSQPAAPVDPPVPATVLFTGDIKPCFPFLDDIRERMAKHRAGSGALKLDSGRGDTMPFGVTNINDLVGVTFTVVEAKEQGATVLAGTVTEVKECTPPVWPPKPPAEGKGGGAAIPDDEGEVLGAADAAAFFDLPEVHDAPFIRGDANDDRAVDLSDAVSILGFLFQGGSAPYCGDASDANDSGVTDISDAVLILLTLFQGEGSMAGPYPQKGFDRTVDTLFCGG